MQPSAGNRAVSSDARLHGQQASAPDLGEPLLRKALSSKASNSSKGSSFTKQLSDAFGQLYREEVHANEPGRLLYAFVAREQRQPWAQGPVLGALSDWVRFRRPRHERSDSFQYGRAFRRQLLDEVAPLPVHSCTMHACAMPTPTHWRLTPRASSWKAMEGHGRPHATGFELEPSG